MTLNDFINEWSGKPCNPDGAYGNQCVDIADQYAIEVVGKPLPPLGNNGAIHFWDMDIDGYDKVANTITGVPLPGDILIWGKAVGQYGHVAIFVSGDAASFNSLDQNWPIQGYVDRDGNFIGTGVVHVQHHNWASEGILGWFHPKVIQTALYKGYDLTNQDSMKVAVDVLVRVQNGELVDKGKVIELTQQLATATQHNLDLTNDLNTKVELLKNYDQVVIPGLNAQIKELKKQLASIVVSDPSNPTTQPQIEDLKAKTFSEQRVDHLP